MAPSVGPQLAQLQARYPDVHFAGARFGEDLARHYASGDVFVFPSRTDTFRLVLLEALASGLPVAAYPVPGPLDVIGDSGCGVLDQELAGASARARDHSDALPGLRAPVLLAPVRRAVPAKPPPGRRGGAPGERGARRCGVIPEGPPQSPIINRAVRQAWMPRAQPFLRTCSGVEAICGSLRSAAVEAGGEHDIELCEA
jgi:Glycosyl transferases group 1